MPLAIAPDRLDRLAGALERALAPVRLAWLVDFAKAPGRAVELVRYIATCAAALAFDTGVFMALVIFAGIAAPLAGAIGYTCGMLLAYVISVRYVFAAAATGKSQRRLITEYCASGLLGVALTTLLIALATDIAGAPPLVAKAVSVAFTFAAIYLVRSAGIFAPREPAGTA